MQQSSKKKQANSVETKEYLQSDSIALHEPLEKDLRDMEFDPAKKPGAKPGKKEPEAKPKDKEKNEIHAQIGYKTITPEIQSYISDSLMRKESNNKSYIFNYIDNFLAYAKKDPNSKAGLILANQVFGEDLLDRLDERVNRQIERDREFTIYRLRQTLFDKQQEVFDDEYDKFITIICGRRAGKTELAARLLIKSCLKKCHHSLYVNRSFDAAIRQMWKPVCSILDKLGIEYKPSMGNGTIDFVESGSTLTFLGNNNSADNDKSRGEKYGLIIVDEQGHQRHLRYLIDEVLQPATIDYADSQLILLGTPPRSKHHYSYLQWHNERLKHFKWTFEDNPFIPNKENVLQQVADQHGVSIDDAFIRREYLGDTEAGDDSAIVFPKYTIFDDYPKTNKGYPIVYDRVYIAVDFGYEDNAAVIVGLSYNKTLYIVESTIGNHMGVTELCGIIQNYYNKWKDTRCKHTPIVITDTNEKAITKDLRTIYRIPNVCLAYKHDKTRAIDELRDWLALSKIQIHKGSFLITEFENTLYKRDENTDEIVHEIDDDNFHPNMAFALLYMSRQFAVDELGATEIHKSAKPIEIESGFSYQEWDSVEAFV